MLEFITAIGIIALFMVSVAVLATGGIFGLSFVIVLSWKLCFMVVWNFVANLWHGEFKAAFAGILYDTVSALGDSLEGGGSAIEAFWNSLYQNPCDRHDTYSKIDYIGF